MQEAVAHGFADRRAAARRRRSAKRQHVQPEHARRRRRLAKALACVCVLALLLLLALVVGDGDYRATALGWVPFLAAVIAVIVAFAYLQVLKRSIVFSDVAASRECERNSDVRFDVEFKNSSVLYFFKIQAFFYVSDLFGNTASEASTTLALGPFESNTLSFNSTFEHIGTYQAGLDRVAIGDFLGLFESVIANQARRQVKVLPRIHTLNTLRFSNDAIVEAAKAARSVLADSMDYAYVRDYELGDPLKSIHWKLSARADHYLTRLYEIQTNPGVVVVLDFYGPSDQAGVLMGFYDAVVESAFSIAQYARERGMDVEVAFRAASGEVRRVASWNRAAMSQLIDDMPRMSNDSAEAEATLALLRQEVTSPAGQSNIVLCSAGMEPDVLATLADAKLRRRAPLLVSVVPRNVVERERDAYCRPLARLDAADVPYIVLSDAAELAGVSA